MSEQRSSIGRKGRRRRLRDCQRTSTPSERWQRRHITILLEIPHCSSGTPPLCSSDYLLQTNLCCNNIFLIQILLKGFTPLYFLSISLDLGPQKEPHRNMYEVYCTAKLKDCKDKYIVKLMVVCVWAIQANVSIVFHCK